MDGMNMKQQLPDAFANRMRTQLNHELPAFLCELDKAPLRGIRINPLKETKGSMGYTTGEPIAWFPKSFYLDEESPAGATVLHAAGAFYIQEPAAMIPAAVLDAKPGENILDLCAAPGGKSTQIGCAMRGKGILVCNEPIPKRARILSGNIERMGIPNAIVTNAWPEKLAEKWPGGFDAVMVDAPCSGEGMFRRDPETRNEWTPEKADGCAARQREILTAAAGLVRPGGRLVYSTCTYNPKENEENADWFCRSFPDYYREAFFLPGIDAPDGVFTCYPHRLKGEGQFVALFRKRGNGPAVMNKDCSTPAPSKDCRLLFESSFPQMPFVTHLFGNTLVHIPDLPDISGIKVIRTGLHLGEIRGRIAVPDHAAAMCFLTPDMQKLELNPDEIVRYTTGETISGVNEGWTLICYQGLCIGWGKGSGGTIKNHFPKGLRGIHYIA